MLDLNTGKPWEKIQIFGLGRNAAIFEQILEEAHEMATRKEEGKTIIFTNWGTEWRPFGLPRSRRSLESVILDQGIAEKIFSDIVEWKNSHKWYSDRGIPYRRGYLLYGPPGSGKTSFIMALAGCLGYNICVLNLAERGLTDDRLAVALSSVPPMVLSPLSPPLLTSRSAWSCSKMSTSPSLIQIARLRLWTIASMV
jgi:mitochondrial chaperone BCS1